MQSWEKYWQIRATKNVKLLVVQGWESVGNESNKELKVIGGARLGIVLANESNKNKGFWCAGLRILLAKESAKDLKVISCTMLGIV